MCDPPTPHYVMEKCNSTRDTIPGASRLFHTCRNCHNTCVLSEVGSVHTCFPGTLGAPPSPATCIPTLRGTIVSAWRALRRKVCLWNRSPTPLKQKPKRPRVHDYGVYLCPHRIVFLFSFAKYGKFVACVLRALETKRVFEKFCALVTCR